MTEGVLQGRTLPLFRNGEWYTSLDSTAIGGRQSAVVARHGATGSREAASDTPESTVPSDAGAPGGTLALSLAPEAVIRHDLRQTRRRLAAPLDPFPPADRRRVMTEALGRFAAGTIDVPGLGPQSPASFAERLLDAAGLPAPLTTRWSRLLVTRGREILEADVPIDDRSLHLVSLPSNTFTCLESCIASALACGALWVRPSAREPFAALRFVVCLLEAGWPPARLGFYGIGHEPLARLVDEVDAAILYGGEALERRFAGAAHVTTNGPGRAVAIVGAGTPPEAAARWLKRLVAADAGRFCTNVGTILCLGDADAVAATLADALDGIALDDPEWPLAFSPDPAAAARTEAALRTALRAGDRVLTRRPILIERDGRPLLAPTLVRLADAAGHPLVGLEYSFPVAAVAAVSAGDVDAHCRSSRFVFRPGTA